MTISEVACSCTGAKRVSAISQGSWLKYTRLPQLKVPRLAAGVHVSISQLSVVLLGEGCRFAEVISTEEVGLWLSCIAEGHSHVATQADVAFWGRCKQFCKRNGQNKVNIKEEVKAILMRAIMLTGFACSAWDLPLRCV